MIVRRRVTVISYIHVFFSQPYIIMQQAKFNYISGVIICLTFAGLLKAGNIKWVSQLVK